MNKGSLLQRLKNYVSVSMPLMVITLNKVKEVDFAAESRGFRLGMKNRTYIDSFGWNLGDFVVSAGCALAIGIIAVLAFQSKLSVLRMTL